MPEVRMVSEAAAQHAQQRSLLIPLDLAEVRLRNDDDTLLPVQHVVDRAEDRVTVEAPARATLGRASRVRRRFVLRDPCDVALDAADSRGRRLQGRGGRSLRHAPSEHELLPPCRRVYVTPIANEEGAVAKEPWQHGIAS